MPPLSWDAFRKSLKKGEFLPAYYLHGDEDFLKDEAVRDLVQRGLDEGTRDFNLDRRRAADLTAEEFGTLANTPPMLAARRAVIITEVEYLAQRRTRAQALKAALVDYLERPSPETLLVLVQSPGEKPDADLLRAAAAVHFAPLEPERVRKWIVHHASLSELEIEPDAATHLHESVGDDLALLAAEIAKLRIVARGRAATAQDVTDQVGVRRGETVHDFSDAVTARRFADAAGMVDHLLETPGTSGVRLIIGLATALVGVGYARALLDDGTTARRVQELLFNGLLAQRPFGLRDYKGSAARWTGDAAHWTASECDAAIETLLRADKRLKSTSLGGEAAMVLEAVLALGALERRAA